MFVRTPRLTLRPGWPEDAPALTAAIGHECVVRNLGRVPWPYLVETAAAFLSGFGDPLEPKFLIFEHQEGAVRLIGGMGVRRLREDMHELGYWLTPDAWGKGYATEAGRGVLQAARARGVRHVVAGHALDNPASGRVLRKLGFRATGRIEPIHSEGRGHAVDTARYALDLDDAGEDARMAA
jgi:RimJ/RimL family protein N-acetyltransferase